jgi:hypothetical protein
MLEPFPGAPPLLVVASGPYADEGFDSSAGKEQGHRGRRAGARIRGNAGLVDADDLI